MFAKRLTLIWCQLQHYMHGEIRVDAYDHAATKQILIDSTSLDELDMIHSWVDGDAFQRMSFVPGEVMRSRMEGDAFQGGR